jgi:hypothetical protein
MADDIVVTSERVAKNFGAYQDMALSAPVTVTKFGRESVVIIKASEYHRLKKRDREALRVEQLSEADVAAIEAAEMPAGYEHLDDELK